MVAGTIWVAVATFIFVIILFITCSDGSNRKKADDSTHTHKDVKISTLPIASPAYIEFLKRNNDFCEDNYNLPETTV